MAMPDDYRTKAFWFGVVVCPSTALALPLITGRGYPSLTLDNKIAVTAGLLYGAMGLVLAFSHMIAPKLQAMTTHRTAQVLFFLFSAAVMLIPALVATALSPAMTYAIFIVALAVLTGLTWIIWRGADELFRRALELSSVWTLSIFQVVLLAYAAAQSLGLDTNVGPWGLAGILLIINLIVSLRAGRKAGLGELANDQT